MVLWRRARRRCGGGQDDEVIRTLDGVVLRSSDGGIHSGEQRRLGQAGRRWSAREQGLAREMAAAGAGALVGGELGPAGDSGASAPAREELL